MQRQVVRTVISSVLIASSACDSMPGWLDGIPGVSNNIKESKHRMVFVDSLKIEHNFSLGKVRVKSAWLEKRWTHWGFSNDNTGAFPSSDGYLMLVVQLNSSLGDTTMVDIASNEMLDGSSSLRWSYFKKPVNKRLCFKQIVNNAAILSNSCLLTAE